MSAEYRNAIDPLVEVEAWMRQRGATEDQIAEIRANLPKFLQVLKLRQKDPDVQAMQAERHRQWESEQAETKLEAKRLAWRASCIPEGIWPLLESPEETQAVVEVRRWLRTPARLLVLAGGPGRGKSTAAAWAIDQNDAGLFVDLGEEPPKRGAESEYWERVQRARLLVLDELGSEREDARFWWSPQKVSDVLTARWNWGRRTILTTRRSVKWFGDRYDASVISRLGDNWVGLGGADMRAVGT